MNKNLIITLGSFLVSLLLWIYAAVFCPTDIITFVAVAAVVCTFVFVCFLVITIAKKVSADVSPYVIFAIADIVFGLSAVVYGIYDMLTDVGFMGGILGFLIIITALPIMFILLLIDFIVWKIHSKKEDV